MGLRYAYQQMEEMKRNHPFISGFTVAGIDMMDNSLYFVGHYQTMAEAEDAAKTIAPEEAVIYKPGWFVATD